MYSAVYKRDLQKYLFYFVEKKKTLQVNKYNK